MSTELYDAVLKYDQQRAIAVVEKELQAGTDPLVLINQNLVPAMDEVGRRFSGGSLYIPEMFLAAKTFQKCLDLIKPKLSTKAETLGRVVIGTVKGDMHDVGKNIVSMMLESGGFEVIDLGVDVDATNFIDAAKRNNAGLLAMSALLTPTLREMRTVIEALSQSGIRDKVRIIVGGAPVTEDYAKQIGADGYSVDAPGAVQLARSLLSS